jgi:hypothetical protein
MRNRRPARCLLYPFLLLAFVAGCQSFHSYRPVAVQVRDADTHQPIPDAEVRIWYPMTVPSTAPYDSCGLTGEDGIARLRAAPYGDASIVMEANAKGYLYEAKDIAVADVQAIAPAHWFEAVEQRPVSFVLEMYTGPRPTVELVVPTGYRGLVKVEVQAQESVPCPPGQRSFSYAVPPSGEIAVVGPLLLRHAVPAEFRARHADGAPLSPEAKGAAPGFWWLRSEGRWECFLVGTRGEYDDYRRFDQHSGAGERRSSGGAAGAGRSRHGHKGGPPPADAGPGGTGW